MATLRLLQLLILHIFIKFAEALGTGTFCSDLSELTEASGTIRASFSSFYSNNQNCKWLIKGETGSIITLDIQSFSTECGYDYLTVYDGNSTLNPIARLCGNRTSTLNSSKIVSSSSELIVAFESDSYVVSTGFTIIYSILSDKSHCSSSDIAPCSGSGNCENGSCTCNLGYEGKLCQTQSSPFPPYSPREFHAVTYEPNGDRLIMTFGADWKTKEPLPDIFVYDFQTNNWSSIPKPESMMARFNHQQWFLNQNTLILFGGQVDVQTPLNDVLTFDLTTMTLDTVKSENAPSLIGSASIFVPDKGSASFSIYVFGGLDVNGYCNFQLFKFSSITRSWEAIGNGPVCYQYGTGVYNVRTNSIRFFGGYPVYDTVFDVSYTFEYSIESNWWTWVAPRNKKPMLFGVKAVADSDNEIAILHGGLDVGGASDCFLKTIWILDLACNTWISFTPSSNVHRYNHGIVYRNQSLWIIGGSDGSLHNDIVEIPLSSDLFPSYSYSLQERDACRATTYCSQINDCSFCLRNNLCQWCNSACGFNQERNPLATTIEPSTSNSSAGSLATGICPALSATLNSSSACAPRIYLPVESSFKGNVSFQQYQDYYLYLGLGFGNYVVAVTISDVSILDTFLTVSFVDQNPYTSFTTSATSNQLTSSILSVNYNNYTRVRVSWSNNAGIKTYDNSNLPPLLSNIGTNNTISFSLFATVDYLPVVTGGSGVGDVADYTFWDYLQTGLVMICIGVFLVPSIAFAMRRYAHQRTLNNEATALMNGGTLTVPVRRPIPVLHRFKIDIPQAGNSERATPLSREEFQSSVSSQITMAATTILVIMPSEHATFLNQGLIPPCSFGTHISISSAAGASSKKEKKIIEMIPLKIIKKSKAMSPTRDQFPL